MKKLITILTVTLMLALTFGTAAVWAEPSDGDGYEYNVTVYSGLQGTYKGKTKDSNDYALKELVTISLDDVVVTNDKYYARGFRVTGHDNDETTGVAQLTFNATTDVAYEVAYGIKGNLVAYTVNYQDESGKTLVASDTFYGMPGDKPVISYKYIEGYLPDVFSKAKTLSDDASENVFTFTYSKAANGENVVVNQGANGAAANGAAGQNGAVAIAPGTAGNPAGTNAGAAGNTTIADNDTPLAGPDQYQDLDAEGLGALLWVLIAIGVAALAIILLLIRWLLKKRRDEEAEAGAE